MVIERSVGITEHINNSRYVDNPFFELKLDGNEMSLVGRNHDLLITNHDLARALKDIEVKKEGLNKKVNANKVPVSSVTYGFDMQTSKFIAAKIYAPIDPNDIDHEISILVSAHEYWMLSHLDHPNIIRPEKFYLMSDPQGMIVPIMTSEKHDNHSIQRLTPTEKKGLMIQVASGLDYMHQKGVVHKDIKPDSLVFVNGNAIIIDLGIAHVNSMYGKEWAILMETMGTENFLAPEFHNFVYSPKSDQYSFGVLGYLLARGRETDIKNGLLPEERPSSISEKTWNAIKKATNIEASERYSSCTEFAYDYIKGI